MRTIFKKSVSLLLALVILVGLLPQTILTVRAVESRTTANEFEGKTISILGDSISTFAGVSNNASYNSTIGSNAVYYKANGATQKVYQTDTWWQQTIDALGLELLVNNSWSGSCILHTHSNTVGAYVDRCVQLHNDKTGEMPDIIAVFMGTNDFSYYQSKLGTADIDYDTLIVENADGSFTYATPTTSCEAYAIMLHKMSVRYPDAEIYCMNLLPRRADDHDNKDVVPQPTVFNAELEKIISHFGCTVVDLENCGIPTANEEFDYYITDRRVHPGPVGMDKMTEALVSVMLGTETEICDISYTYTGIVGDNAAKTAIIGGGYRTEIVVAEGFSDMDVTVIMDGADVTDAVYADGVISIDCVAGDIVITATAKKIPAVYRWELDGDALISSGKNDNTPTLLGGSVSNGIMSNAYYNLAEQVVLRHDLPWVLEFKASGSWSGMLFSALKTSSVTGNTYLFKTTRTNGFIGFGEYSGSQYNNYGIALGDKGIDTTLEHTYRLENRIAADGSNMVYLLVDGVDCGAMNNYFIAGNNDQKKTVDWLNGKDLFFSFIGASGHAINKCALDYIQVSECLHTYEHGICTVCGEDSVNATLVGNTLSLSGELTVGTKILVSCYNGERFAGTKVLVWQGEPLQEVIPDGESVKLLFVDEDWLPLRKPVNVK